jgi:uroporphyrinogen-III synthase
MSHVTAPATLDALSGYVVGITADRRWQEQAELLERRGARTIHGPCIRTFALSTEDGVRAATTELLARPPDAVVLTTGIGTRGWIGAVEGMGHGEDLVDALDGAMVLARGPKAAGAALTAGIEVTWRAPGARTAEVVGHLREHADAGRRLRIAVQLDGDPDARLVAALRALGHEVVAVPVYRWTLPDDTAPALRLIAAVCDGEVDAVTFTAGYTVGNLLALADGAGVRDRVVEQLATGAVTPVAIGPACAERLRELGLGDPVEPATPRLGAMVRALTQTYADRVRRLRLVGRDVLVQGRVVAANGDAPVELSGREREVLDALAQRPGAVVSKRALLERVWGGAETDEHVVEVTVARLRRRLGPAGTGIETVVRRGYRLAAD